MFLTCSHVQRRTSFLIGKEIRVGGTVSNHFCLFDGPERVFFTDYSAIRRSVRFSCRILDKIFTSYWVIYYESKSLRWSEAGVLSYGHDHCLTFRVRTYDNLLIQTFV